MSGDTFGNATINNWIGIHIRASEGMVDEALSQIHWPVAVEMPCGYLIAYNLETVPRITTLCPCGNPHEWLIYYQEWFDVRGLKQPETAPTSSKA